MKAWNEREPEVEAAFRICAEVQMHEDLRRLPLDKLPQNIQGVVAEIRSAREPYRQLAVDALNELQELRKQIIHGGAWTKKIDALFERATKAGLRPTAPEPNAEAQCSPPTIPPTDAVKAAP